MATSMRVRIDDRAVRRMLRDLRSDQVPFAVATAINGLAQRVVEAERKALPSVFDRPTAFTLNAFAIRRASKAKPYAVVFAKDIQAEYLSPFETGGVQALRGKEGLPKPVDIRTNAFGNLPRNTLQRLHGRSDVFFGRVGEVSGVWQRKRRGGLKLLIQWIDPRPVKPILHFGDRAVATVNAHLETEFAAAMAKALATAR